MLNRVNICSLLIALNLLSNPLTLSAEETTSSLDAQSNLTVKFTPPQGWRMAEKKSLPQHVLIMVVGKGRHEYPPSMNLGYECYNGTLKDYMKIVKDINLSQGCILKDLGTIQTNAGPASLSQFDEKTEWGEIRQMHAILLKDGVIYILTASALKEEFSKFYQEFFNSMQSLQITTESAATAYLN